MSDHDGVQVVDATCTSCGELGHFAAVYIDLVVIDSVGGVLFEDGWTCDGCLGGDAAADSLVAALRYGVTA